VELVYDGALDFGAAVGHYLFSFSGIVYLAPLSLSASLRRALHFAHRHRE